MVSLRKVSNSEKQHDLPSPPAYEDVIRQGAKYSTVDPRLSEPLGRTKSHLKRRKWGRKPVETLCHMCGIQVLTVVDFSTSFVTHATAATILAIGMWPIAWCPYMLDICKTANHYCPHCHAYIGKQ